MNWNIIRGLTYVATFIASILAMLGVADFDPATGHLAIHPFNLYSAVGALAGLSSSGLAWLALIRGWGRKCQTYMLSSPRLYLPFSALSGCISRVGRTSAGKPLWRQQSEQPRLMINAGASKMTFSKMTICMGALCVLASCAAPKNDACAGWRPVQVDNATARAMAMDDPQALRALIAHQEFGQAQGCW